MKLLFNSLVTMKNQIVDSIVDVIFWNTEERNWEDIEENWENWGN